MLGQKSNPTLQPGVAEQEPYCENAFPKWQCRHSSSIIAVANDFPGTEKTSEPKQDRSPPVLLPVSAQIHQPLLLECKRGFGLRISVEELDRSEERRVGREC